MNKIRKPLSFLLAVVMIISMFAAAPFTASAEDGYTEYELPLGLLEGTPLTDQLPSTQGTYYLTQDITISSTWLAPSGATTIDLNGYGIRMTGTGTVIDVCRDASCVLTLNDSRPTYSGGENRPSGILGGYITGGTGSKVHPGTSNASYIVGGGIFVNNAVLNINGGTIYGNSAAWGGGIYINNDCTVNMTGGAITGNSCARGGYGGGVFLSARSTFNVSHTPSIMGNYYSYNGKQYPRNVHMQVVYSGGKPLYAVITIVSPGLTAGAQIGIYEYQTNAYPVTSGYSTYHSGVDPGTYFSCDNAGWAYKVNSEGELLSVPAFTITWLNEDGTLIDTTTVAGGTVPTHADATKDATAQYTYTFAGWTPAVAEATRDATYTATFTQTDREYTITWKNDDGSVIDTTTVPYGTVPTHDDATKDADAQYTYTFAGWDKEIVAVTGDATYTATYDTTINSYTITWKNDDGSVIDTTTVPYGTVPTHADATKAEDSQYTYTFAGWDTAPVAVTGDATYTATFTTSPSPAALVIEKINAIGTVEYTDACKAKIDDARAAYDALTDTQKELVTNVDILTTAETAYAALELAQAKTDAKAELANYKDPADYRPAQQTELTNAINAGNDAIDGAADIAGVNTALANAKTAIDAIKTDAELTAEELAQAKTNAKAELANYKDPADYRPAQQTELTNAINAGNDAIDAAADIAGVNTALANAKAAIDAIKTDAELTAEEAAAAAQDWMSVRIDDQIYIKYTLQKRENLESVTVEYLDQDGVEAVQTKVYTADQLTFDGNDMFEILAVVAPAQIGDMVKVTILANGQPTVYEYSVAKYCEYLIANYNGENARAVRELAKATLEYGKAANDYFYGTGFYHQSTITSPYSADYKEEALHRAKNLTNTLSVTGEIGSKLASAAFMALTKPEFRFYTTGLTEAEAYELNSKITTNVDGVTARFYKNGDGILLEVKGIEAKDMDKSITITVGELGTITFSGYDFARMMANSGDQSIAALGAALYLYGKAAADCFPA